MILNLHVQVLTIEVSHLNTVPYSCLQINGLYYMIVFLNFHDPFKSLSWTQLSEVRVNLSVQGMSRGKVSNGYIYP